MKRSYSQITTPGNTQELFSYAPSASIVVSKKRKRRRTGDGAKYKSTKMPSAFPSRKRTTLRYVQTLVLDPGAGGTAQNLFRCIGAFDPDFTLGGHQPYGFDQWMAIYKTYHVMSAKIKVQACAAAVTGTTKSWRFGLTPIDRATAIPSLADDLMETSGSVFTLLETGNGPKSLTLKQDTKTRYGVKDVLDNEHLSGTVNTNPADETYWILWVGNGNNGVTDPEPVNVLVTIDYDIWFTDVNDVINS